MHRWRRISRKAFSHWLWVTFKMIKWTQPWKFWNREPLYCLSRGRIRRSICGSKMALPSLPRIVITLYYEMSQTSLIFLTRVCKMYMTFLVMQIVVVSFIHRNAYVLYERMCHCCLLYIRNSKWHWFVPQICLHKHTENVVYQSNY